MGYSRENDNNTLDLNLAKEEMLQLQRGRLREVTKHSSYHNENGGNKLYKELQVPF